MDPFETLHKRDAKRMLIGPIEDVMRNMPITKADVDKYFVMNVDEKTGQIMSYGDFLAMDIGQIGGWIQIRDRHINQQ